MSENIEGQIKDLNEIADGKKPFKSEEAKEIFPNIEEDARKLADEMQEAKEKNNK